jgi:hypothetical protein
VKFAPNNNDLTTINSTMIKSNNKYSNIGHNNSSNNMANITNDNIIGKKVVNERSNVFYRKYNNNTNKAFPSTPKKQFQKKNYVNTEHKYSTHKIKNYRDNSNFPNLTTNPEGPIIQHKKERTYKNPKTKNLKELSNLSMLPLEPNKNLINKKTNVNKNYKCTTFKIVGNLMTNDKKNENDHKKKINKR